MKKNIILLFVSIMCLTCSNYKAYNISDFSDKDTNEKELNIKFSNFENYPLRIYIKFSDLILNKNNEVICSENSKEYFFKDINQDLKIFIKNSPHCLTLIASYLTYKPFQKNESSELVLKFNNNKDCKKVIENSPKYIQSISCKYLDFSEKNFEINLTNLITDKLNYNNTFNVYISTFLIIATNNYILTPFPFLLSGYKTNQNYILFKINEY
ncbi:hypothetical protein [Leptospira jelokensis]|uniref:hypothetical protein n=1 Tax=Leptospira jelokensis TaxID=2484931 RepID=UPI001091576F|nr:hypothetical protein [Leptospira jelokensis]TGM03579.1 hypothetical protein EHQ79_06265 [Leptospira jelokensis]